MEGVHVEMLALPGRRLRALYSSNNSSTLVMTAATISVWKN
jgi:hypothetical protein